MPCSDSRDAEDRRTMQDRLDKATRAACELMRFIENLAAYQDVRVTVTPETFKWIEEHKRLDQEREASERAKAENSRTTGLG